MDKNNKIETIDEYIDGCTKDVKEKLIHLRRIILEVSPDLLEKISWGMPTFYFKGNVIHFASNKKHIGLYCGKSAVEEFSDLLQEYKTSNGTIQIPYTKELDVELIQNITKFNLEMNRNK
ncbi:MAG: DUF1801 domain-containing protein [Tissierellaceae bacterium]|nr:DUF1801 domain-containing protein [Tissierellaceae bacterium]